jgi:putative MATE family efflux protein
MKNPMEKDLTQGNSAKLLRQMAVPLFVAFLLNIAYNIIDTIWVGNLIGENAVAALTVSYPLVILLTSFAMGATNGTAILISKYFGAKDEKMTDKIISTSLVLSVAVSILIAIACELATDKILIMLNTPSIIFQESRDFLRIYLVGFIFVYLYLYLSAVLRSMGNTMTQMLFLFISTIVNIILDPLFIKGWGIIPEFGVAGSAISTLIAQGLSVVMMIIYIAKNRLMTFSLKHCDKNSLKMIIAKSVPSAIQQSIPAISTSFITSLISGFGIAAIAAFGIAGKLEPILLYPAMALNMAITAASGQCFGACNDKKAKEYFHWGIIYGTGTLLILSAAITIFAKSISGLFVHSEEIASIVSTYFLIIAIGYLFHAVTNCFIGMINGLGKPMGAMLIMTIYFIIIRMPMAKLLSITKMGIDGIWVAVLISHFIAMLSSAGCYAVLIRKKQESADISSAIIEESVEHTQLVEAVQRITEQNTTSKGNALDTIEGNECSDDVAVNNDVFLTDICSDIPVQNSNTLNLKSEKSVESSDSNSNNTVDTTIEKEDMLDNEMPSAEQSEDSSISNDRKFEDSKE